MSKPRELSSSEVFELGVDPFGGGSLEKKVSHFFFGVEEFLGAVTEDGIGEHALESKPLVSFALTREEVAVAFFFARKGPF